MDVTPLSSVEGLTIIPTVGTVIAIEPLEVLEATHIEASTIGHPVFDVIVVRRGRVVHRYVAATLVVDDRAARHGG